MLPAALELSKTYPACTGLGATPGDWVCRAHLEHRAQLDMSANTTALCKEKKRKYYGILKLCELYSKFKWSAHASNIYLHLCRGHS